MTIYTPTMAVETPDRVQVPLTEFLDVRDQSIRAEIQVLGGKFDNVAAELQRGIGALDEDLKRRPESADVTKAIRSNLAWFGAILLSILAIIWAAFDTGSAVTASFSDEILGARATHEVQASEIRAMNVKYEQINTKLDTLIQASAQPAAAAVYEVPKEPRQEPQRR